MIRMIVAPLLALTATAGAQTCEYKPVMTDADIEACRHPAPAPAQKRVPSKAEVDAEIQAALVHSQKTLDESQAILARRAAEKAAAEEASKPKIGMTSDQVRTLKGWGRPRTVNKTTNARGESEQWVFYDDTYLYFDNGVLTSVQEKGK